MVLGVLDATQRIPEGSMVRWTASPASFAGCRNRKREAVAGRAKVVITTMSGNRWTWSGKLSAISPRSSH